MAQKVVIIGAGIGGLATACLLAQDGYDVTVLEKNDQPGGRLGTFTADGFTFDTGPSWYLMPDVFERFFKQLGEDVDKLLEPQKLDPSYQVYFKETLFGSVAIRPGARHVEDIFESFEPGGSQKLKVYLEQSSLQYQMAIDHFLYRNYDYYLDFLTPPMLRAALQFNIFTSMHKYVTRRFASPELQKILMYPMLFLGTDPRRAPALYNLMNHITLSQGVFYPKMGMYSIVQQLVRIADGKGVKIVTSSPVEKIVTKNSRACGVVTRGETIDADIVISNADIEHTERALLEPGDRMYSNHYWKKRSISPSALLIYLGVNQEYSELTHHNLVFSKNWDANMSDVFSKKKWPHDPSFYVCNTTKTNPETAPEGSENLFVLAPIPAGLSYDNQQLEAFADSILATMETTMHLSDLRKHVVYKRLFCVKDFQEQFNSYKGSALGLGHTLKQTAIMRPANIHKKVKNLYFVGANTTPGIGLPMCLISAELIQKRLLGK